jgi:hypothetical protein
MAVLILAVPAIIVFVAVSLFSNRSDKSLTIFDDYESKKPDK